MPTLTADRLLAGPRGRRLALACAVDVGPPSLMSAAFHARRPFNDPRAVRYLAVSTDGPVVDVPEPNVTVAEVAAELDAAPATVIDAVVLRRALDETVGAAMYWEAPDGDDAMLATGELTAALHRYAEAIVACPDAAWWADECAVDSQYEVAFSDPAQRSWSPSSLRELAEAARDEEQRARRENRATGESSGEWWSTTWGPLVSVRGPLDRADGQVLSPNLVEDGSGWETVWVRPMTIGPGAQVVEIASPEDWAALCRAYPFEITHTVGPDWRRVTGLQTRWVMPDWEAVAADYDGVHLSVAGYLASATLAVEVDPDRHSMLAAWRPDATEWLTDVAEPSGDWVRWRLVPDSGRWAPA